MTAKDELELLDNEEFTDEDKLAFAADDEDDLDDLHAHTLDEDI